MKTAAYFLVEKQYIWLSQAVKEKNKHLGLLQNLTIHPRQENILIELQSSMVWLISCLPEEMRKPLKVTPKLACLNAKVWFPRPGNTRVRPQLLATYEPGLQEEKPYKVTSEKKLPLMSWRVNPHPPRKALVNSLKVLPMSV